MEIKELFIGSAVILVGVIAIFAFMGEMNTSYGENAGAGFNSSMSRVQTLLNENLTRLSSAAANNSQNEGGSGDTNTQEGLIRQSWSTITQVGRLLGIIPDLIEEGANAASGEGLGIPNTYVSVAKMVFLFAFGIMIAYLLLLGVQNLRRLF